MTTINRIFAKVCYFILFIGNFPPYVVDNWTCEDILMELLLSISGRGILQFSPSIHPSNGHPHRPPPPPPHSPLWPSKSSSWTEVQVLECTIKNVYFSSPTFVNTESERQRGTSDIYLYFKNISSSQTCSTMIYFNCIAFCLNLPLNLGTYVSIFHKTKYVSTPPILSGSLRKATSVGDVR